MSTVSATFGQDLFIDRRREDAADARLRRSSRCSDHFTELSRQPLCWKAVFALHVMSSGVETSLESLEVFATRDSSTSQSRQQRSFLLPT